MSTRVPKNSVSNMQARTLPCPKCKVGVGDPCVRVETPKYESSFARRFNPRGRELTVVHQERRDVFRASLGTTGDQQDG